jgi:hypothetical protein
MDRTKLTQAVNLAICLDRGYYLGTVARDKQEALEGLKMGMTGDDLREFNERVK